MRIVLDTNVVVSGMLSADGPPASILALIAAGRVVLLADDRILAEYDQVLRRPRFALNSQTVTALLSALESVAEFVAPAGTPIAMPDPADTKFLQCALSGLADALVTGNRKHFPSAACGPVEILSPAEFLARYGKGRSAGR